MTLRRALAVAAILLGAGLIAETSQAGIISVGTATTAVPASLFDPLTSLTSPLPAGQILLPIEITGANVLQDWSFDLTFDDSVVTPKDVGGLYQSVYQSEFNATDPTLSNITSSGILDLLTPDVLQGVAGFSSGVSGDGLLAFVLFEFVPGQETANPDFGIAIPSVQVPEPSTLALFMAVAAGMGLRRVVCRGKNFSR